MSHQTVSRVLNGHPNIRPATRERVLRVMEEVNYRPNSAARALATSKTNRVGVLVDSPVEYGPNSTLRGIEMGRARDGVRGHLGHGVGRSARFVARALEHLMSQGIDALCVIAPRSSSLDRLRAATLDIPALVITAASDDAFLTASVDQELGAALAVRHLIELGHRRIAHVAGPLDWLDASAPAPGVAGRDARGGARGARRGRGRLDRRLRLRGGADAGRPARLHGDLRRQRPDGARADPRAGRARHRCPGDVSIVGFDDLPEAKHFLPPLTTVRQDFRALGERSVEVLLGRLEGREHDRRSVIEPQLVVRASTAAVCHRAESDRGRPPWRRDEILSCPSAM